MNNQNKYDNRHNKLRQTEAEFNNMLAYLQEARENSPAFNRRDARDLVNNVFNAMRDATLSGMDSWSSEEDSNEGNHTLGSLGYQPLVLDDIYNGEAVPSRPASQIGKSSYTVRLSPLLTSLASSFVFIHNSSLFSAKFGQHFRLYTQFVFVLCRHYRLYTQFVFALC